MNTTIRSIVLVSGLAALASFAPAQALNSAANAAASVRVPAIPPPPPPPAVNVGAAAQGAAAAAATVRPPVLPPASVNAATAAQSHVAAGVAAGTPNISAQTHASVQGQAAGVAFNQTASNQAAVSMNPTGTVRAIREAAFADRERVNAEVQARLEDSSRIVADLRARAEASGDKSRAALAKALVAVRQHEQEVRANLRASTKAAKESSWGEIQSALAQSYGAYAQAIIQAEASVQPETGTEPKS